ncbi:uncharacterized protein LOC132932846 [Metopolophium dirhodum]|uniref:uncharacterized protein LOC132932846 n=1 Tax=Metopolophium dirhodum TaxID=44670 RepID=UPI00298F65F0|nr:uncharacterized protein LOC132932846 [Metopolophium dirhodum]
MQKRKSVLSTAKLSTFFKSSKIDVSDKDNTDSVVCEHGISNSMPNDDVIDSNLSTEIQATSYTISVEPKNNTDSVVCEQRISDSIPDDDIVIGSNLVNEKLDKLCLCLIDAEKYSLLKRNCYDEINNTQTSLFSPAMINSDNDEAERTLFFSRKLKFKTDNSKERRNHMENIRYISPCNSPDFSNNEVPFDLEKSTGRKSFSLCEDHDAINDKEFKKQIIRHVMYFKVELKHITNTLTINHYELLERVQSIEKFLEDKPTKFYEQTNVDINCMSDCSIPIDNVVDLNTLEDKTLGDQEFKKALINELSHVGGKNVKTAVKRVYELLKQKLATIEVNDKTAIDYKEKKLEQQILHNSPSSNMSNYVKIDNLQPLESKISFIEKLVCSKMKKFITSNLNAGRNNICLLYI